MNTLLKEDLILRPGVENLDFVHLLLHLVMKAKMKAPNKNESVMTKIILSRTKRVPCKACEQCFMGEYNKCNSRCYVNEQVAVFRHTTTRILLHLLFDMSDFVTINGILDRSKEVRKLTVIVRQ